MSLARAALVEAAGVDPWALHDQVASGDPEAVESLAATFFRAGRHAREAAAADARAQAYRRAGYQGRRWVTGQGSGAETLSAAGRERLPAIARTLAGIGDELATTQRMCAHHLASLEAELAETDSAALSVALHPFAPEERLTAEAGFFRAAVEHVADRGAEIGGWVDRYATTLTSAERTLGALGYAPGDRVRFGQAPPVPAVGTSPASVAAWWLGLTPGERDRLLSTDYATLGQLRGLPAAVLDTANRQRFGDYLATLRRLEVTGSGALVLMASALITRCRGLRGFLESPLPLGAPPRFLLRFDPDAPEGTTGAQVALGNPDAAADTAVLVPGSTHSIADIDYTEGRAAAIYGAMRSPSRSVVLWLDGPLPSVSECAFDNAADDSAPRLTADLAGLRAAHDAGSGTPGHLTAIGHSYGTYVLGKALTAGSHRYVDDAIFTGSPGVGVDHASELGMDPRHVWSGQAGDDWILTVKNRFTPGINGFNPEEGAFGAQHFDVTGSHGHSEYFDGESLHNIARVADGDYGRVHAVPAPDYRGPRELVTDVLDAGYIDPIDYGSAAVDDLAHGHVLGASADVTVGMVHQGGDLVHTGEDIVVGLVP